MTDLYKFKAWMRDSTCRKVLREKTGGASLWRDCVEPASELHMEMSAVGAAETKYDVIPAITEDE